MFLVASAWMACAAGACVRRTCEEVTADRKALLEESQACSADQQCGVYKASELIHSGCGVIALRSDRAQSWAEHENDLADEADDVCDDDDDDDIGEAIGEGLGCALSSIFVSDDPADYRPRCEQKVCTAVLLVP
jgi:hypothetical protein